MKEKWNVLVAMDSFKGSLSSREAGEAVKKGILAAMPDAGVELSLLADGGEGTVEALTCGLGGERITLSVTGPLGEAVQAEYGIIRESQTAIVEMAAAAGLLLVPAWRRNPLYTTTYGVGEIIKDAVRQDCRRFIIGIGGSATNDGGMGMLKALGVRFTDEKGAELEGYGDGEGLSHINAVDVSGMLPELKECTFRIACDVDNPLYGPNGAAYIYGRQKGAEEATILQLDKGLRQYAEAVSSALKENRAEIPGAGAAGGLGYAFLAFLQSRLEAGIQIVINELRLEMKIAAADIVVVGEGKTDGQTAMGKAPVGIARLAGKYGKRVIALSGSVGRDGGVCNREGIHAVFSIIRMPVSLEEAMQPEETKENLSFTAEQVFRLIGSV